MNNHKSALKRSSKSDSALASPPSLADTDEDEYESDSSVSESLLHAPNLHSNVLKNPPKLINHDAEDGQEAPLATDPYSSRPCCSHKYIDDVENLNVLAFATSSAILNFMFETDNLCNKPEDELERERLERSGSGNFLLNAAGSALNAVESAATLALKLMFETEAPNLCDTNCFDDDSNPNPNTRTEELRVHQKVDQHPYDSYEYDEAATFGDLLDHEHDIKNKNEDPRYTSEYKYHGSNRNADFHNDNGPVDMNHLTTIPEDLEGRWNSDQEECYEQEQPQYCDSYTDRKDVGTDNQSSMINDTRFDPTDMHYEQNSPGEIINGLNIKQEKSLSYAVDADSLNKLQGRSIKIEDPDRSPTPNFSTSHFVYLDGIADSNDPQPHLFKDLSRGIPYETNKCEAAINIPDVSIQRLEAMSQLCKFLAEHPVLYQNCGDPTNEFNRGGTQPKGSSNSNWNYDAPSSNLPNGGVRNTQNENISHPFLNSSNGEVKPIIKSACQIPLADVEDLTKTIVQGLLKPYDQIHEDPKISKGQPLVGNLDPGILKNIIQNPRASLSFNSTPAPEIPKDVLVNDSRELQKRVIKPFNSSSDASQKQPTATVGPTRRELPKKSSILSDFETRDTVINYIEEDIPYKKYLASRQNEVTVTPITMDGDLNYTWTEVRKRGQDTVGKLEINGTQIKLPLDTGHNEIDKFSLQKQEIKNALDRIQKLVNNPEELDLSRLDCMEKMHESAYDKTFIQFIEEEPADSFENADQNDTKLSMAPHTSTLECSFSEIEDADSNTTIRSVEMNGHRIALRTQSEINLELNKLNEAEMELEALAQEVQDLANKFMLNNAALL